MTRAPKRDARCTPRRAGGRSAVLLFALAGNAGAQAGTIDAGDARIYYEAAGRGPAAVLIHGWALNLRQWDDQVAALAPRFRVVAYDRRGFGQSTGFADISADPGDLLALLDTLGIRSAVLVGHSAGTQVAYRFTAAFPDRVDGLVLYGAGTPPEGFPIPRPAPRPNLAAVAQRFGLDSVRKLIRAQPGFRQLQPRPDVEARIDALWAAYSGRDLLENHPQSGRFPAARVDDVKRWPIPTLFIVGEHEAPYTRLIADSLAAWMPNARRVVVAGGGHGVHFQQPEPFNAAVVAFLIEVARGR